MEDPANKEAFQEALKIYYKMKADYEETKEAEIKRILGESNKSRREKRREFLRWQPRCIHCKQRGGTIFTMKYNKDDDERVLQAYCGNREDPCPLRIIIHLGNMYRVDESLVQDEKILEDLKKEIIVIKNRLLFGYITTEKALQEFDEYKKVIEDLNFVYETNITNYYLTKIDNPETKAKLLELRKSLAEAIQESRQLVDTWSKRPGLDKNKQLIRDAVTLYIDTILRVCEEIRGLAYPEHRVEFVEEDNSYHLIQKWVSIADLEKNFSEKWGVEKLVLGQKPATRRPFTSVPVTLKTGRQARPGVPKTMKRRIQREPQPQEQQPQEPQEQEVEVLVPTPVESEDLAIQKDPEEEHE